MPTLTIGPSPHLVQDCPGTARGSLQPCSGDLLEAIPQPAAILALDGDVVAANGRWTALAGSRLPPAVAAIAAVATGLRSEVSLALDGAETPREDRDTLRLRRLTGAGNSGSLVLAIVESSNDRLWRELGLRTENLDAVTEAMTRFLPEGDLSAAAGILLRSAMIRTSSPAGLIAASGSGRLLIAASEGFPPGCAIPEEGAPALLASVTIDAAGGEDVALLERLGLQRARVVPILLAEERLGFFLLGNGPGADAGDIDVLVRAAGVLLDARRRRQHAADLERQLRGAQRIESIGRLAGGVAHDYNNLLTVVLGLTGLMRDELAESHPHARLLDEITEAGRRAAALTRQLLAFSRRQVLQPELMDLNAAVSAVRPLLDRLVPANVEIVLALEPGIGHVVADVSQIEQVLVNLVVNARDAMPRGGRVTITTRDADLDDDFVERHVGARSGAHVMLSVADTGSGMDGATLARVFEPFFTTKPAGSGTGLGLATVYGIVKQSGGSIWAAASPDCGATFEVYLPRAGAHAAPRAQAVASAPVADGGGETVLVVEDEPALREMVVTALKAHGYAVLSAASGEEALRVHADAAGVRLVLTDLVMTGMSGGDLVTRLRAIDPAIRVIMMTGYSDMLAQPQCLTETAAPLLEKPFALPTLLREVRSVLDSSPTTAA